MEAFNAALPAKQVWSLIKTNNSLVARLLQAKYFPDGNIFNATLGARPSYTWRSLLNIWEDRWLPRPKSFKPITPKSIAYELYKVHDLIDHDNRSWKEELIHQKFLPIDADIIWVFRCAYHGLWIV